MRRLAAPLALVVAAALAPAAEPVLPKAAQESLARFRDADLDVLAKPQHGAEIPEGWRRRVETEWELASLDAAQVPALAALLGDASRHVRHVAARSIGIVGAASATPRLIEALSAEKNGLVKIALVEALARTGGDGALAAVEAQQSSSNDRNLLFAVGLARRQLKGGAWDVASIRAEHREARGTELAVALREERAPELALPSPQGPVNLSLHEGRPIVLVFTHGDRGTHCNRHLSRLASRKRELGDWNVLVIVVDPHEKERTQAWSQRLRLPFVFCSDPAGRAQARYGVARQLVTGGEWLPSPAWFVIDKQGVIAWSYVGKSGKDHPPLGKVLPILERVKNGELIED